MARLRPRSMLFTLFGDYAYPAQRDVKLSALVELGARLGMRETAVRSAVARLSRQRWLLVRRSQGRSYYDLSARGRALIEEGTRRIYGPRVGAWQRRWTLLTYSVPEKRRALRDRIRKRIAWLGFGSLGSGTYVCPRPVLEAARTLVADNGLAGLARVFSARFAGPGTDVDVVRQCWDLGAIAAAYEQFIAHYAPLFARDARRKSERTLPDAQAFALRFALTHDFRRFPFADPGLPPQLLPKRWPGARARRLFERYHKLLTPGAMRYFRRCLQRHDRRA